MECPKHSISCAILCRIISQTHALESVITNPITIIMNSSVEVLLLCLSDLLSSCAKYGVYFPVFLAVRTGQTCRMVLDRRDIHHHFQTSTKSILS